MYECMKRKDILALFNTLNVLENPDVNKEGEQLSIKFKYAVAKNLRVLLPEVQALSKASEESVEYGNFKKKSLELGRKNAEKDESGNPVQRDGLFVFVDEKKAEEEFMELKKEYDEVLKERDRSMQEYEKLLELEVEVNIHKVLVSDVPEFLGISSLYAIIDMVDGEIKVTGVTS